MKNAINQANKKKLNQKIKKMHPYDILENLKSLTDEENKKFYELLDEKEVARIVTYLEPEEAADIIDTFELDSQKEIIEEMELDDAADIFVHLDDQKELLDTLDSDSDIVKVLTYQDQETGAHMSKGFVALTDQMDIKTATRKVIKEASEAETINHLFVLNESNEYLGAIELKALIKAKEIEHIEKLIKTYPFAYDHDDIDASIHKIKEYGLYELPVLNDAKNLIGVLTLDDAMDIYHEAAQDDFEKLSALPDTNIKGFFKSAFKRLPWLFMLLILSIPIALATTSFEHVIASVAVLALFQPLILDAGGDIATQTLAVTLRILSKDPKGALKNGGKEILAGLINGLLLGVSASIISYFLAVQMQIVEPFNVAIVVGISLTLTVVTGPIFGLLIPITLNRFKIDPAIASGPFITTLIDVTSVFIYFGLATFILGVV